MSALFVWSCCTESAECTFSTHVMIVDQSELNDTSTHCSITRVTKYSRVCIEGPLMSNLPWTAGFSSCSYFNASDRRQFATSAYVFSLEENMCKINYNSAGPPICWCVHRRYMQLTREPACSLRNTDVPARRLNLRRLFHVFPPPEINDALLMLERRCMHVFVQFICLRCHVYLSVPTDVSYFKKGQC